MPRARTPAGIGLLAAAAVFFHPRVWEGGTARLVATGLLAAALLLPVADIALKRPMTAFKREREAVAENPIEALLPGTRVPVATVEGARLFCGIAHGLAAFAREVSAAGFFLDPDPTTNAPAAQLAWAIGAVEAGRVFERNGYRDLATRYATLAFADPFSRMLGLSPARGTTIAIDIGRTLPVMSEAEAEAYLADADGVFVDQLPVRRRAGAVKRRSTPCWRNFSSTSRCIPAGISTGASPPRRRKCDMAIARTPSKERTAGKASRWRATPLPLVLDLDGTLVRGNLLVETACAFLRQFPLKAFMLLVWLLRGRAVLKQELARRADIDVEALPLERRIDCLCRGPGSGGAPGLYRDRRRSSASRNRSRGAFRSSPACSLATAA